MIPACDWITWWWAIKKNATILFAVLKLATLEWTHQNRTTQREPIRLLFRWFIRDGGVGIRWNKLK